MLPKGAHVLDAFSNPSTGLLSITRTGQSNKLFIECSTIEVSTSLQIGLLVARSDLGEFLDAPVSGGPQGADAGSLTLMCGGSPSVFERALPILALMGKPDAIFHCGGPGAGLATKQLNNYLSAVAIIGLSEGKIRRLGFGGRLVAQH
jgi:3-hydroxyisobutyrate dehydrogenase